MPLHPDTTREVRLAATLSGVIALRMLGLFLILPVFMVLAQDMPGFTPWLGGLALGAYGLTQALLQQPFGWLSDRLGRRPVLLGGLMLFAAGGIVAALAESMTGLVFGRALQGCGAIAGVAMAFAADFTRPEKRPIVMAVIGAGIGAAFLVSLVASVPLAGLVGLSGLFWLTAVFALMGMALILTTPRLAVADHDNGGFEPPVGPVRLLAVSVFLLHAAMTSLFVVLPGRLISAHGLLLAEHWRLYLPAMLVSVLVALPVLAWAGRRGAEHATLPWAFVVLGGAMALLAGPFSAAWLGAWLALYFIGFNVLEAAMPALVARLSGRRGRGRRLGFYSTCQFLGAFAGGLGGGLSLGWFGGYVTLLSAGGFCIFWGLIVVALSSRYFPTGRPN